MKGNCKKCHGSGYIPEYRHIQDGICFLCWGTGKNDFYYKYPQLCEELKRQVETQANPSEKNELTGKMISLIELFFMYESNVNEAVLKNDEDSINYYEIKKNEIITELYSINEAFKK